MTSRAKAALRAYNEQRTPASKAASLHAMIRYRVNLAVKDLECMQETGALNLLKEVVSMYGELDALSVVEAMPTACDRGARCPAERHSDDCATALFPNVFI